MTQAVKVEEEKAEQNLPEANIKASGLLAAGHLTVDSYGGFLTPIMPFLAAKIGISVAVASMILSVSHLTSSILQPVFGYIADSMTRRFFVFWGLVFAAVFFGLTGVMPNAWLLGLAIVLGSLGVGFYHPQATSLVHHFSGKKINIIMSIFTACGTAGYAVGPLISSNLVARFGISSTPLAILPGLIIALLIYTVLPKIPASLKVNHKGSFKEAFCKVFTNKILAILTIISIIKALISLSFNIYIPFLWKSLGYSVSQIGFAVALFSLLGGIASPTGGKLSTIIGSRNVFYISLIPILPVALGMLYFVRSNPTISFILYGLLGFFTMLAVSENIIMAQKQAPENKGMISGVIGGFSWGVIGVMLTPLGLLAYKFGISNVLTVIAVVPLLTAVLVKHLPRD